jgi:hypothetical protein
MWQHVFSHVATYPSILQRCNFTDYIVVRYFGMWQHVFSHVATYLSILQRCNFTDNSTNTVTLAMFRISSLMIVRTDRKMYEPTKRYFKCKL